MKKIFMGLVLGTLIFTLTGCGQPTPAEKKVKQNEKIDRMIKYFRDANKKSIDATKILIADSKTVLPKDFNEREYKNPFIKESLSEYKYVVNIWYQVKQTRKESMPRKYDAAMLPLAYGCDSMSECENILETDYAHIAIKYSLPNLGDDIGFYKNYNINPAILYDIFNLTYKKWTIGPAMRSDDEFGIVRFKTVLFERNDDLEYIRKYTGKGKSVTDDKLVKEYFSNFLDFNENSTIIFERNRGKGYNLIFKGSDFKYTRKQQIETMAKAFNMVRMSEKNEAGIAKRIEYIIAKKDGLLDKKQREAKQKALAKEEKAKQKVLAKEEKVKEKLLAEKTRKCKTIHDKIDKSSGIEKINLYNKFSEIGCE